MKLILYSTDGCHLCEEAQQQLVAVRESGVGVSWEVIDIADDDVLFERYGWSIPVLAAAGGSELKWPFDGAALRAFIEGAR